MVSLSKKMAKLANLWRWRPQFQKSGKTYWWFQKIRNKKILCVNNPTLPWNTLYLCALKTILVNNLSLASVRIPLLCYYISTSKLTDDVYTIFWACTHKNISKLIKMATKQTKNTKNWPHNCNTTKDEFF